MTTQKIPTSNTKNARQWWADIVDKADVTVEIPYEIKTHTPFYAWCIHYQKNKHATDTGRTLIRQYMIDTGYVPSFTPNPLNDKETLAVSWHKPLGKGTVQRTTRDPYPSAKHVAGLPYMEKTWVDGFAVWRSVILVPYSSVTTDEYGPFGTTHETINQWSDLIHHCLSFGLAEGVAIWEGSRPLLPGTHHLHQRFRFSSDKSSRNYYIYPTLTPENKDQGWVNPMKPRAWSIYESEPQMPWDGPHATPLESGTLPQMLRGIIARNIPTDSWCDAYEGNDVEGAAHVLRLLSQYDM